MCQGEPCNPDGERKNIRDDEACWPSYRSHSDQDRHCEVGRTINPTPPQDCVEGMIIVVSLLFGNQCQRLSHYSGKAPGRTMHESGYSGVIMVFAEQGPILARYHPNFPPKAALAERKPSYGCRVVGPTCVNRSHPCFFNQANSYTCVPPPPFFLVLIQSNLPPRINPDFFCGGPPLDAD